jgi:hypothetical protein
MPLGDEQGDGRAKMTDRQEGMERPDSPQRRPPVSNRTYGPERVVVDGMHFADCLFDSTQLVYFGGAVPVMNRCELKGVRFVFEGPAKNTVDLLQWLRSQNAIEGF